MAGGGTTPDGSDPFARSRYGQTGSGAGGGDARPPGGGRSPAGGTGGTSTVTGSFPSAYARVPDQQQYGQYAPTTRRTGPANRTRRGPTPKPKRFIDYPRWGRTGWTRWIPSWKLIAAIIGMFVLTVFAVLGYAYGQTTLPAPDALAQAQSTVVYFSDGKTAIATLAKQDRQIVQLAQVPTHVRQAVLAAEDRTFYSNSGIDPTSIARAAWSNVRGNSLQGGSTISQQYVKNVYNQRDRTYKRKAKEIFLAIKVNRQVSKDEILERYLNTIYLGDGSYGVQSAAKNYFNKDVSKLSVSEGAFLAGIINAPSLSNPRGTVEQKARALRRWNVVMDAMVTERVITPQERTGAKFPKFAKKQETGVSKKGQDGYLVDLAKAEATKKLGITEDELLTGGYRITTSFNQDMIEAGVRAVKQKLPNKRPKGIQVGMSAIDPRTGALKAIYGGYEYRGPGTSNATVRSAQAGSTFKPFGLMAALDEGLSLKNRYRGTSPMKVGPRSFKNFGNTNYYDYPDLVKSTANSINTVYAQLNKDIGPDKTKAAAYAAGIPRWDPNTKTGVRVDSYITNILGTASPHPVDMASAYATFAAEGIRRDWWCVQKITQIDDGKQTVKFQRDKASYKGKRVFEADHVADLTYALEQVVKSGSGSYARQLGRPAAGKTGTSTSSKSAWFVGYTPQLATAVGMWQTGIDKKTKQPTEVAMKGFGGFASITGGSFPVQIWTTFMQDAMKGQEVIDFPSPTFGGEVEHRAPVVQPTQPVGQPTNGPQPGPSQQPTVGPTNQPQPSFTPQPTATQPVEPQPTQPGNGGGGGGGNGNGDGNQVNGTIGTP